MNSLKIVHVSDLHFGADVPAVIAAITKAIKDVGPDLILATGDITQRARAPQFIAARQFMDQFHPTPMISIPGNHDIPLFDIFTRLFNPYRGYLKFFKGSLQGMFHQNGVEVLTLNSTYFLRHVQGHLPIDRLETALEQFQKTTRFRVVAFHHPMDCLKPIDEHNILRNGAEAIKLFSKYKVDLVVGGHIHDPVTRSTRTRYPNIDPAFLLSVAGTSTSYRVRRNAPNSFNVYEFKEDDSAGMHFKRYEFSSEDSSFHCKTHQDFNRSESGEWS